MEQLKRAIDESDWPAALAILLERWRAERTPQLADLIDRVGGRCGSPPAADAAVHAWWLEHARPYDAAMVTPLVEHADLGARSSDEPWSTVRERWAGSPVIAAFAGSTELPQHRNWIERVAAILAWPDDPRASRCLARWLAAEQTMVSSASVYSEIAARLVELGDTRAIAVLAEAPIGGLVAATMQQLERSAVPDDAELAALAAVVEPAGAEREPLWRAVADRPADLGARMVLGDALVAAGDARGELIALQLAPADGNDGKRERRIKRLLDTWWEHWLGPDLAAIAVRDGTEFRNGMLEVLRLGRPQAPGRAWRAARGHRELRTVHTVRLMRSSHVASGYAQLLAALPHLTTFEADAPETLEELGRLPPLPRVHTVTYVPPLNRVDVPQVRDTFRAFAPAAPALAHLTLDPMPFLGELDLLVEMLPGLFPQLRAIELLAGSHHAARTLGERFASVPLVRVG